MAFVDNPQSLAGTPNIKDQIDYMNLGPRFKKHLEYAYLTASEEERKRCTEALNTVGNKRPQTAMPFSEHDIGNDGYSSPYSTTYKKQYFAKQHPITIASRPSTTGPTFSSSEIMDHTTHYDVEYARKTPNPNLMYRTGTASGNRSNKPHPSKEFLTWRFPTNKRPPPRDVSREIATDAKINEIHRRLCRSTYQSDFLGMPQGYQIIQNGFMSPELQEKPNYCLNTFQRSTYQQPYQHDNLRLTTTRYGGNYQKNIPVYGTIPQTNGRRLYVDKRTTYDRHYNHNISSPDNLADIMQQCDLGDTSVPVHPMTYSGLRTSRSILPHATPITSYTPSPAVY